MSKSLLAALALLLIAVSGNLVADDGPLENARTRRARPAGPQRGQRDISAMFRRFDTNNDGVLEGREIPPPLRQRLGQIDANKDGKLTLEEARKARGTTRPSSDSARRQGEIITPAAQGERHAEALKVGDRAPDFTLSDPSGKREVTLSSFQGKRPVVLIFGSYT